MRTLLTSFGPFPRCSQNPSRAVADALTASGGSAHGAVEHVPLETSFEQCRHWARNALTDDVGLIVHLGVAMEAGRFRLETTARNLVDPAKDDINGMSVATGVVVADGPNLLESRLPLATLCTDLVSTGLPVELSSDAGDYVCNFVYYSTLHAIAARRCATRAVFLHLPPLEQDGPSDARQVLAQPLSVHVDVVGQFLKLAMSASNA